MGSAIGKIEFVLSEFFRSFRKSLFKDILLMIMILIGSVMTIILCSYYFDMNEQNDINSENIENGTWYSAGFENFDDGDLYNSLSSIKGCKDILSYFEKMAFYENHPMFFADMQQSMFAFSDEMKLLFRENDFNKFLTEDHTSAFSGVINDELQTLIDLKSVHVDYNAYRLFGFKTVKGEGITEDNTILNSLRDDVPVVLGNAYENIINIGDRFHLSVAERVYPCKVVGILEENTYCPEDGQTNAGQINIDTYIVFPYGIRFRDVDGSLDDIEKYAFWDILAMSNSPNVLVDDSKNDFIDLVQGYNEIADEFSFPVMMIQGTSLGLNLLRSESKESVQIMLLVTIALVCFTIYSLFAAVYDKVQSNKKVYGIYLVNGCSIKMIVASYIMEITIIVIPSILAGNYIFDPYKLNYMVGNITPIKAMAYCIAVLNIIIVSAFALYVIGKVDTEKLIREE